MANNTILNLGAGGDTIQNIDNTTYKTPVNAITNSTGTTFAAVKAASTAAVATDPALVVAISPNNILPVSGTFWQATQPVSGTFWQATQPVSIATAPVLVAGSAIIGKVGIDQTTVGTTNAMSVSQIGANTVLTGNGVTGTGSQRVTIASDNTAFAVNSTLSAETTKVIGTVNLSASQTIGIVAGSALVGKVGIDQTTVGTTNAVSLAQIGATTIVNGGVSGTLAVGGMTAVNSTSTGNPEYSGGIAVVGANPTKATNGQRTGIATDAIGRFIPSTSHERTMVANQVTTITSSTAETTVVTAGATGVFNDLTSLTITNSSTTASLVTLKDSTGGTTRGIYSLAAGGGVTINYPTPKAQNTAANAWSITCGTSVASIYVVAEYIKNS